MEETLSSLQDLDLKTSTADDARKILTHLPVSFLSFTIRPNVVVLRTRKGRGFATAPETTYCPVEFCTNMQRVTLANDTIFYGA